jgi:3-oxoacyl-[acyl-carrier-protein] synthase II
MSQAIDQALEDAGLTPNELDFVSASANGGRLADRCEGEAILQSLGESVPVTAIKSMLGETLGAGGPIQVIAALESLRTGLLPGIRGLTRVDEEIPLKGVSDRACEIEGCRALINSFGLDGNACAVVVERT